MILVIRVIISIIILLIIMMMVIIIILLFIIIMMVVTISFLFSYPRQHYHHCHRHLLFGSVADAEDVTMIVIITDVSDAKDATMSSSLSSFDHHLESFNILVYIII